MKTREHSNKKRVLSLFLAIVMLVGFLPGLAMPAQAAQSETEQIAPMASTMAAEDEFVKVSSIEEFKAELHKGGDVKIMLDADITLDAIGSHTAPYIPPYSRDGSHYPANKNVLTSLVVDGQGEYALTDAYWNGTDSGGYESALYTTDARLTSITFQNMNIFVGNQYGLVTSGTTGRPTLTTSFLNCSTIECRALVNARHSSVIIRDCTITNTNQADGGTIYAVLTSGNITIGGRTVVNRNEKCSPDRAIFYLYSTEVKAHLKLRKAQLWR